MHCPKLSEWEGQTFKQITVCKQGSEVKAWQCGVVKPSSCCRWTHRMQLGAKIEEQLGMNAVLEPRGKDTEPSLPWVWVYHALSLGECNLYPVYRSPLSTSHQSWHPVSIAFRNRMWDTRDAVHVLFTIVIPAYRKAHLDAVPGFQWRSWVFSLSFWTELIRKACDFAQGYSVSSWGQSQHDGKRLMALHWTFSLRIRFSPRCRLSGTSTNALPPATGNSCIPVG